MSSINPDDVESMTILKGATAAYLSHFLSHNLSQLTGPFIRRLSYPTSEISVNTSNVQAAIARQGADNLETRVWWDKP